MPSDRSVSELNSEALIYFYTEFLSDGRSCCHKSLNWLYSWVSSFFQNLCWLTKWFVGREKWFSRCDHVSVVFNISLRRHIMGKKKKRETDWMREWDSVTDRGRERTEDLAVTAFSLLEWWMNDVVLPPQHSLRLQSINPSRVIWPDYCVNLEYSSGSFFCLTTETLLGTCRALAIYFHYI